MATRLYFSAADAAPITPAFNAGWVLTADALRRTLLHDKRGTDTRATGATINMNTAAVDAALDRQYISDPLPAGQVLTGMTVTGQLQVREFAALDDVTFTGMVISTVTSGGAVTELAALGFSASGTEFINNASCRNSTLPPLTLGAYTTAAADRLIVEIGYQPEVTGATPQAAAKWGTGDGAASLSDLPVNETDLTALAGWIEFSGDIGFTLSTTAADTVTASDATAKTAAHPLADTVTMSDANTANEISISVVPENAGFQLGTGKGLMIGTGVTQKLGFFGTQGLVRQAKPTDAASIIALLVAYGLCDP